MEEEEKEEEEEEKDEQEEKEKEENEKEECIAHFHCDPHTVVVETGTGLLSGPQTETHGQLKRDTNKTQINSLGNI